MLSISRCSFCVSSGGDKKYYDNKKCNWQSETTFSSLWLALTSPFGVLLFFDSLISVQLCFYSFGWLLGSRRGGGVDAESENLENIESEKGKNFVFSPRFFY